MPNVNDALNSVEETVQSQTPNPADAAGGTSGTNSTSEGQPAPKQPVSLKDDDLVEVIVDGQPQTLTYREAKAGWQRQQDYTRKTQTVASKLKEIETLYGGLKTREQEIQEKELAIDRILGRAPAEAPVDGDAVVTTATLNKVLADFTGRLQGELARGYATQAAAIKEEQTFQRWQDMTTSTVQELVKEYPALEDIPHLEGILKAEAARTNPQSERDMIAAILQAGKTMAERQEKRWQERRKQEVQRKQDLVSKGPERSGGTLPPPQKKSYNKGRAINWSDLEKDVIAALETPQD